MERARLRTLVEGRLRLVGTVEADNFDTLLERLREDIGMNSSSSIWIFRE
jgi:hypothetical protein